MNNKQIREQSKRLLLAESWGLNHHRMLVLLAVGNGNRRMEDLHELTGVYGSRMSESVYWLDKRGLISRTRTRGSTASMRAARGPQYRQPLVDIRVTPEGREMCETLTCKEVTQTLTNS